MGNIEQGGSGAATLEDTLEELKTAIGLLATQTTVNAINTKIPASPAQESGNLASIKTNTDKIPSLGQALAASSVPVILPSATITTLTPPPAITGFATSAKQDDIISAIEDISGLQRSTDIQGNGLTIVGTTAVEVAFTGTPESIIIEAANTNTGTLYVGKSTVTNAGANAFCSLVAGQSVEIDYDDTTNAVYVVASVAGQYFISGCLK